MNSLWDEGEAGALGGDALALRVYTSRLLGRDPALVMHGGGNTSVKSTAKDVFGDGVDVLYVKGSGWDLGTIEREGFAPEGAGDDPDDDFHSDLRGSPPGDDHLEGY